jgi:Gram-negative bacterial TonB protein C-terminal
MFFRRSHLSLAVLFLAAASISSSAQKSPAPQTKPAAGADWETLKPENEDFSILMPKNTATEITKFAYHKMELSARLYLSAQNPALVVAVASISGIKSNPAAYSDFERFNSYVDAFKTFFPPRVRKDAVTKMILVGNKPFHGYTGRVYKLTMGDLNGTVNAYVTRKRFYAIAVLNTKKDEALEDKFLSSFVIPDKPADQQIAAAEDSNINSAQRSQRGEPRAPVDPEGGDTSGGNPPPSQQENNEPAAPTNPPPNSPQNQPQQPGQKRPPIAGGILNGKAIYLPLPEIPAGEKAGVVMVQILVDEQGMVIDARAISGPVALHAAAVNAARFARFSPTMLMGEPVRVQGTLAYNFVKAN